MSNLPTPDELIPKYHVQKDGFMLPVGTYFVLRSSDVFAPAGLHGYAANILTSLELPAALQREMFNEYEQENLHRLADVINTTALNWAKNPFQKIPD